MNREEIEAVIAELALSINDLTRPELRMLTKAGRAHAALTALLAENERLREALTEIKEIAETGQGALSPAQRFCIYSTARAEAAPVVDEGLRPRIAGQFDNFGQWVSRASRWLAGVEDSNGYPLAAICVDTLGRRCANGRDFMRARDEGTFPVVFFWDCESAALEAALNPSPTGGQDHE